MQSQNTRARPRLLVVVMSVMLSVMIVSVTGISQVQASAASGPPCNSSFDPYRYTQAQVQACGYATYPRLATADLAGGGSTVEYKMKGRIVKELFPPPGFRPESASTSQLEEYGFPPRPTDPAQLARWQDEMSRWTGTVPPAPFLAETHATVSGVTNSPTADTVTHSIWAGYVVTAEPTSLDSFSHAEGWYAEPSIAASHCANPSEVTWAGLGGYYSPYNGGWLAQNGTGWNVPGLGAHQAWWEIVPENGITPVPNFYGTPGWEFDASVRNIGGGFRFWFMNYQTGKSTAMDEPYPSSNALSAEVIIERPTINGAASDLANFQTLYVFQSEAWINFFAKGTTFDNFPPNLNSAGLWRHGLHMYNYSTGKYYAEPSGITAPGDFTVTQESCDGT